MSEVHTPLWPAVVITTGTSMMVGIFPLVLGAFAEHRHLTLEQVGLLATAAQIGFGLGAAAILILRKLPRWRTVLVASGLVGVLLNAASAIPGSATAIMLFQLASGALVGAVYGSAVYVIGTLPKPERAYGIMYAVGLAAYTVYAAAFPLIIARAGFGVAINSLGAFVVLALFFFQGLPGHVPSKPAYHGTTLDAGQSNWKPVGALASLAVFELGIFAVWAYTERIGTQAGHSPEAIGTAVAVGGIAGAIGAGFAAKLGTLHGRFLPTVAALLILLAANLAFHYPAPYWSFVAGCCLFSFGWLFGIPYYMGLVIATDRAGHFLGLVIPAQTAGAILGPLVCALAVGQAELDAVLLISSGAVAASVGLLAIVLRGAGRRPSAAGIVE